LHFEIATETDRRGYPDRARGGSGQHAVDLAPGDSVAAPTTPSSPNVLRYMQMGLIGLVLGGGERRA